MAKKQNKSGRPPLGAENAQKDPGNKTSRHVSPRESFHLPSELQSAFYNYLKSQEVKPDKSETLRTALREFLEKRKFWPPKADDEQSKE